MFTEATKKILFSSNKWELVSSFLPVETKESLDNEIQNIDQKHTNCHLHREILIPIEGSYTYSFNGKFYKCEPGKIFLIDSGDYHEFLYTKVSSEIIHLWIYLHADKILSKYIKVTKKRIDYSQRLMVTEINVPMENNINTTWNLLKQHSAQTDPLISRQRFLLALSWLLIKIIESDEHFQTETRNYQKEIIEATQMYIKKSFAQGVSADQLARSAGYSKFHFLRLFKKYSGFTVHEYINICRKNEFDKLHKKNIYGKEIAHELGFASTSAFYNWISKRKKKSEL